MDVPFACWCLGRRRAAGLRVGWHRELFKKPATLLYISLSAGAKGSFAGWLFVPGLAANQMHILLLAIAAVSPRV